MRIRCQKLSYNKLRELAEEFLDRHHPDRQIPVPIEDIVDEQLRMDIIPVRQLQKRHGIEGGLGADFMSIYVDEWVQDSRPGRYHFTLAHELAHRELHMGILSQVVPEGLDGWIHIGDQLDDDTVDWMEWQAYSWAGLVLVPSPQLAHAFATELQRAKDVGFYADGNPDLAKEYISEALAKPFAVSPEVIYKRIGYDKLI